MVALALAPAIGLEADPLVHRTGLPADAQHGLRVDARLQSIADARVFAAGDCAHLQGHDLPKLGVFGVRQARVIHANLCAALDGRRQREYHPQPRYLAVLNLGDGSALACRGGLWWHGRTSLWLKDHIDRKFMRGYRRLYARAR